MKNLFAILLLILSSSVYAKWDFAYVSTKDQVAGIIYYTSAVGTQQDNKTKKSFTSLRFVCSLKSQESIIAINWAGIIVPNSVVVSTYVDNKFVNESEWLGDEFLIYKNLTEAEDVTKYFKSGKIVEFKWEINQIKYTTAFVLAGIDLGSFNSKCKVQ